MATTIPGRSARLQWWSASIPIALPLFLLGLVLRYIVVHGAVGAADEGTEAHLFQLLLPVQLVLMAYFALSSIGRSRRALVVLAVQLAATIALLAAVYWVDHLPLTG
jgi:hypothetical protein